MLTLTQKTFNLVPKWVDRIEVSDDGSCCGYDSQEDDNYYEIDGVFSTEVRVLYRDGVTL